MLIIIYWKQFCLKPSIGFKDMLNIIPILSPLILAWSYFLWFNLRRAKCTYYFWNTQSLTDLAKAHKSSLLRLTTFCPFSSMVKFLSLCSQTNGSASLFIVDSYKPTTRSRFSSKLHVLCLSCGLPTWGYSPHSLKICAATTAAFHLPTSTLKSLGCLSSSCLCKS